MKKLTALLLALVMVLAMSATAFAADDTYKGANDPNAIGVAGTEAIPMTKSIIFFNENSSAVYEPNITFKYTVEPATLAESTTTVNDGTNVAYVHPGVTGGVAGVEIPFTSTTDAKTSSPDGVEVEETRDLSVDLSKFSAPGIYRYKITERVGASTDAAGDNDALKAAGLTAREDGYIDTRYLDVYIRYNAARELEMYGAVIFSTAGNATAGTDGKDSITTDTEKTTGFQPGADPTSPAPSDYKSDVTVDKYTTYDFTVKKTVSGLGDKNHEFPFYVDIANSIAGAKYTYKDKAGTSTPEVIGTAATIAKGTNNKDSTLKLKDGESVTFVGVPSNQTTELTVDVTEYNDTVDKYVPEVTAKNGTITMESTNAAKGNAMTEKTGSDSTSTFAVKTNDVTAQILTIDNNLPEISPTGVVLRVAPYAIMLGAGVVLFIILKSRKNKAVEEA